MAFRPKPIYRMARCRKCPRHCKPCLTVEEATAILDDESRRSFNGDSLCDECHKKSNESQNRWTYRKAGRDWDEENMDECERLEKELARLTKELAKLQARKAKTL